MVRLGFRGGQNISSVRAFRRHVQRQGKRFGQEHGGQPSPFASHASLPTQGQSQPYAPLSSRLSRRASPTAQALLASMASIAVVSQVNDAAAEDFTGSIPQFVQGQHVYFHPSTARAAFEAQRDLSDLSIELFTKQLKHPFYVVFFDRLTGRGDHGRLTGDAAWDVRKAWKGTPGFDAQTATIVAIPIAERKLATNPGLLWQKELGFSNRAVTNFERRHFVPLARNGHMIAGVRELLLQMDRTFTVGVEDRARALTRDIRTAQRLLADPELVQLRVDLHDVKNSLENAQAVHKRGAPAMGEFQKAAELLSGATSAAQSVVDEAKAAQLALQNAQHTIDRNVARGKQLLDSHTALLASEKADYHSAARAALAVRGGTDVDAMKAPGRTLQMVVGQMESAVAEQPRLLRERQLTLSRAEALLAQHPGVLQYDLPRQAALKAQMDVVRGVSEIDLAGLRTSLTQLHREAELVQDIVARWESVSAALRDEEQSAQQLLEEHIALLEGYDLQPLRNVLDRVPAALEKKHSGAAGTIAVALSSARKEAQAEVDARLQARRDYETRRNLGGGAAALLLTGLGVVGWRRRQENLGLRAGLDNRLNNALGENGSINVELRAMGETIDRLNMTRGVVESLRNASGETATAFADVSSAVLQVFSGLEQLEERMTAVRGHLALDGGLTTAREADALLHKPITISTEAVKAKQRKLFDPPAQPIKRTVDPISYMGQLQGARSNAESLLAKIESAIAVARRNVREDYPRTDLGQLEAQLAEADIPTSWLSAHPLNWADDVWKALDAFKVSDPLGYVSALERYQAVHADFVEEVDVIRDAVRTVREARAEALAVQVDYAATTMTPELNPESMQSRVQGIYDAYMARIQHPAAITQQAPLTAEAAEKNEAANDSVVSTLALDAADLEEQFALLKQQRQQLADNIAAVGGEQSSAVSEHDQLRATLSAMEIRYAELARVHDGDEIAPVLRSQAAFRTDLTEAETLLQRVAALLKTNQHTAARNMLRDVQVEFEEARANHEEFMTRVAAAEHVRAQASAERAVADELRGIMRSDVAAMEVEHGVIVPLHAQTAIESITANKDAARAALTKAEALVVEADGLLDQKKHGAARVALSGAMVEFEHARSLSAKVRAGIAQAEDARKEIDGAVSRLDARHDTVEARHRTDTQQVQEAASEHRGSDMRRAEQEHRDAATDIASAESAFARARTALEERRFVDAMQATNEAQRHLRAASQDQDELDAAVGRLESVQAEYTRRYRALQEARSTAVSTVRRYDGSVSSYLRRGDSLYDELAAPGRGRIDYASALPGLSAVTKAWKRGASSARSDYEAEQARIAAERRRREARERERKRAEAAARRRRERRAAARRRTSSFSSGSSSSFGGGGSSGVSWGGGGSSGGSSSGVGW